MLALLLVREALLLVRELALSVTASGDCERRCVQTGDWTHERGSAARKNAKMPPPR